MERGRVVKRKRVKRKGCKKEHYNENPIYVFLFWELRGLSPNFHIHVSMSDLYIPQDRSTYFLKQNRQIDRGNK
jgi:hypothetical protein